MTNTTTPQLTKPNLVGINHVALEVGSIDEALAFYGSIFTFKLRGRENGSAFIDMGDQFIALMETPAPSSDRERHFGLVVDDRAAVRQLAEAAGAKVLSGRFLDFLDPWGNRVQVVEYSDIQFTKAPQVLSAMGLDLKKSDKALKELADKGITF
jgi:Predicted enzyme related to lactoylglutathione lyase